mgnify:CR=1 FL=1
MYTVFYNEVKNELDFNLEYEDSAVRQIIPRNEENEFMDKIKEVLEQTLNLMSHKTFNNHSWCVFKAD